MSPARCRNRGLSSVFFFSQTLCIYSTWVRAATALPQAEADSSASITLSTATFNLLPITGVIPSALNPPAPSSLISSQSRGFGLIPSQAPPSDPAPLASTTLEPVPSGLLPAPIDPEPTPSKGIPTVPVNPEPTASNLIPSATIPPSPISSTSNFHLIPSLTVGTISSIQPSLFPSNTSFHGVTSMASTDEGLHPIPAPTTAPGDPNGHNEISEPNFTATVPCRGCSPVIEISKTGFFDWPTTPIADNAGTSTSLAPTKATITAGPSQVIISKESTGMNWLIGGSTTVSEGHTVVVDRTTVSVGETVIIDHTPVVIQTSNGATEVIIGTGSPITLQPDSQITPPPFFPPIVLGSQTISANSLSQYIFSGQTLSPGGSAITVDGTTISLLPSATALVVNGVTTTLAQPLYNAVYTSTIAPLLTLFDHIYTAEKAGWYILGPGTTLIPGGSPITVSGTVLSLDPRGTAVIVQGSTSSMAPQTTIVTITRGGGFAGPQYSYSNGISIPTGKLPALSAGPGGPIVGGGWLEGVFLLGMLGIGWLAIWL